jgi:hypothetical protein
VTSKIYNICFKSSNPIESILSNLAHTPFTLKIKDQEIFCQSVEGFWQGLKLEGEEREKTFQLWGFPAKYAGRGIKKESFEINGLKIKTSSLEHKSLIHNAIYEKVLQNELVYKALMESQGNLIHKVPGTPPLFKVEEILKFIYSQLKWEITL